MTRRTAPVATQSKAPLWKVGDAAEFLRLSHKSIYALVESGQLPCVRIGSRIRFIPSVLAAWVETKAADDASHAKAMADTQLAECSNQQRRDAAFGDSHE